MITRLRPFGAASATGAEPLAHALMSQLTHCLRPHIKRPRSSQPSLVFVSFCPASPSSRLSYNELACSFCRSRKHALLKLQTEVMVFTDQETTKFRQFGRVLELLASLE